MRKAVFLLLLCSLFSCKKSEETKPFIQDIKELVFASGQLEWEDAYNVTAQTDGILQNATFDVGTVVRKGNTLASIENKSNDINTKIAQQELAISNENLSNSAPALAVLQQNIGFAESKYEQDRIQLERYKRLFETESVSRLELENMQLAAKSSISTLNALKKQRLEILQSARRQQLGAQRDLQNTKVTNAFNSVTIPESGTVIKKIKGTGDFVKRGDIIATVANSSKTIAVLNIDENSISKIKVGQQVFLQLNTDKNKTYTAQISEILSAYDEQTQSFICKAIFQEPLEASLFGTQLEANILIGEKKKALLIPRSYLGFGNRVNVKGKEDYVIVRPGIISADFVEILSGIGKDDVLLPLKL